MAAQSGDQRLILKDLGDVMVATFTDRHLLEAQKLQVIDDQLSGLVNDMGRRKLILSFGNVRDISSLALGVLVTLHRRLNAVGGKLVLCGMDPQLRELMTFTQLDTLFVIRDDEQEALKAF